MHIYKSTTHGADTHTHTNVHIFAVRFQHKRMY